MKFYSDFVFREDIQEIYNMRLSLCSVLVPTLASNYLQWIVTVYQVLSHDSILIPCNRSLLDLNRKLLQVLIMFNILLYSLLDNLGRFLAILFHPSLVQFVILLQYLSLSPYCESTCLEEVHILVIF